MPEELGIPRQVRYRPREFSTGSLPNYFTDHGVRKTSFDSPTVTIRKAEKKLSIRPLPATPPALTETESVIKDLAKFPWFQNVSRSDAEIAVSTKAINGQFLVRRSVHGGKESPLTLTVHFEKRIYHLNIRLFPNGKCSLGKKKTNEVV